MAKLLIYHILSVMSVKGLELSYRDGSHTGVKIYTIRLGLFLVNLSKDEGGELLFNNFLSEHNLKNLVLLPLLIHYP